MKSFKYFFTLILILVSISGFAEKIPVPELKSPVTDLTGTLLPYQINMLEKKLYDFEKTRKGQIAVLIIPTTSEESIEEFSIRVAEAWKIGSDDKDDGIIITVAKNDRKVRIEVGYGLEKVITDAEAGFIIDDVIVPAFKSGDFYRGIDGCVDSIIGFIDGTLPSLSDDNETSYKFSDTNSENPEGDILFVIIMIIWSIGLIVPYFLVKSKLYIMLIIILSLIGIGYFNEYYGELEGFGLISMIIVGFIDGIPFLMNLIGTITGKKKTWSFGSGSSYSGGSWSSSSSSSWGSSSGSSYSSGSSSWSGGGGSFGGGGASGSW